MSHEIVIPVALAFCNSAKQWHVWLVDEPEPRAMVTFTVNVLVAPTAPEIAERPAETVIVAAPATLAVDDPCADEI